MNALNDSSSLSGQPPLVDGSFGASLVAYSFNSFYSYYFGSMTPRMAPAPEGSVPR